MLETGIRQFRMAMGMVWGRKLDTTNLARLVEDALATIAEFGEPGSDVQAVLDGPLHDPAARAEFANRSLRRTARRLDAQSPFYHRRFAAADIKADKFDLEMLRTIPVTVKRDLIERQAEFQCADSTRYLATRTTGTTGRPAEIWLSRYEIELLAGLGALSGVLRDESRSSDVVQVNVSSRATLSVHLNAEVCRLVGSGCRVLGIVPPDEALDSLTEGGVTLLSTVPSYLGELVVAARRRGLGPEDFQLRRIDGGGEVLSTSLAAAARETFGVSRVSDIFAMTEVAPVTGRNCSAGHLHHDINMGLVELLDLETGEPAAPGALSTVVITPYFPYRECMPVFRYDTRDVVRCLPEGALECEAAAIPATSPLLGKADQILRLGPTDVVTPRELVEAVEALPSQPWPSRFRAQVADGRLRLSLPESALDGIGEAGAREHFAECGLDVDLTLVSDADAASLRPLRSDLHETTFVATPALIGE
ncbi:MAG TPA: AMP-binding protein [Jatrophihabitans sp.]|jgi:phenylacetate-coenzyme A ligase PaaK-like adenylate-forming protein|nr:AMP-binding protein [Jatrophihabitans sp.]